MSDSSVHLGSSVAPVGSFNVKEMKVAQKGHDGQGKKRHPHKRSGKDINTVIAEMNNTMGAMNRHVTFSIVDEGDGEVVQMKDAETQRVLKEVSVDVLLEADGVHHLLGVLVDKNG